MKNKLTRKKTYMLKRFEVENFKSFKDRLVFDLQAREYEFNKNLVVNEIVNKSIIYGKNGIGKSNLGIALFDIVLHLTDKERMPTQYLTNYLNLDSLNKYAEFKYVFVFDDDEIVYEYKKSDPYFLIEEKLTINNTTALLYNYFKKDKNFVDSALIGNLQVELIDNKLSIIKYIYRNTPTNQESPLYKMMVFVENMLWYRGLSEGNSYCGFTNGGTILVEGLYNAGKKDEFQKFLADNGLNFELGWRNNNGLHELMAKFPTGKSTPFVSIASTGTMSLFLFFFWSITAFNKISLLFIDEFDAFFHYESAENIILRLNANKNFQTILTSHNTYLMQNKLTRPDCCYIMTQNKITSLFNSTKKEIREAHNLEKMYINGAFNE